MLATDARHRQKYGLAATPPGDEYPEGWVVPKPTPCEPGEAPGVDGGQLEPTAAGFSEHAARGEDPDFGRGTFTYVNRFAGDPQNKPNPGARGDQPPSFHGCG